MQLCKLTTQSMTTHGDTLWVLGEWQSPAVSFGKVRPCTSTVLHFYSHPLIAVLMNPVHAAIDAPRLFGIEVAGCIETDGTKHWTTGRVRLVEEIELPLVTADQRIKFAILCAKEVCSDSAWLAWADKWLSGKDRTAYAAADAASAADAARAAAEAAYAAAHAARAARAARAAAEAVYAADAAGNDMITISMRLITLAKEALQ